MGNLHCVKSTVAFGLALCLLQSQVKQKVTITIGHPKNRLQETIMFTAMRMFNFYHYYDKLSVARAIVKKLRFYTENQYSFRQSYVEKVKCDVINHIFRLSRA